MDQEFMPKVNLQKDRHKINSTELEFMKRLEKVNFKRVSILKIVKKKNIFTGLALGAGVFGIYGYTLFSVRQEKFLDDFKEPEVITN